MPVSIYVPMAKKGAVERDCRSRKGRQAKREGESPNKIINTQTKISVLFDIANQIKQIFIH